MQITLDLTIFKRRTDVNQALSWPISARDFIQGNTDSLYQDLH